MKSKLILLILLLLGSISISAQRESIGLKPKVALDIFTSEYGASYKFANSIQDLGEMRTRVGLDFIGELPIRKPFFKDLKYVLSSDNHFYMDPNGITSYNPKLAVFIIGAGLKFKEIKLSFEHQCVHPIKSDGINQLSVFGGYSMFSLSYGY